MAAEENFWEVKAVVADAENGAADREEGGVGDEKADA